MTNLPCEIVRDLLPSYADGLTDPVTNKAVEAHLERCAACREVHARMTGKTETAQDPAQDKELNFLKKNRRRSLKVVLFSLLGALVLLIGGLVVGFFLKDREIPPEGLACTVQVEGDRVDFRATAMDSATALTRVSYEYEDGVLTLHCRGTLTGIRRGDTVTETVRPDGPVREIRLGNRVLWADGTQIWPQIAALYNTRHPYLGDMSANRKLAEALEIPQQFGVFTNELQTAQEPYGWTLTILNPIEMQDEQVVRELRADAVLMLALIDNLGEVRFEYKLKDEDQARTLTLTREEADGIAGRPVLECGQSPALLQQLAVKVHNLSA